MHCPVCHREMEVRLPDAPVCTWYCKHCHLEYLMGDEGLIRLYDSTRRDDMRYSFWEWLQLVAEHTGSSLARQVAQDATADDCCYSLSPGELREHYEYSHHPSDGFLKGFDEIEEMWKASNQEWQRTAA